MRVYASCLLVNKICTMFLRRRRWGGTIWRSELVVSGRLTTRYSTLTRWPLLVRRRHVLSQFDCWHRIARDESGRCWNPLVRTSSLAAETLARTNGFVLRDCDGMDAVAWLSGVAKEVLNFSAVETGAAAEEDWRQGVGASGEAHGLKKVPKLSAAAAAGCGAWNAVGHQRGEAGASGKWAPRLEPGNQSPLEPGNQSRLEPGNQSRLRGMCYRGSHGSIGSRSLPLT